MAETAALARIARRVRLGRTPRVAEARCRVKRRLRRLGIRIAADADTRELIRAGMVARAALAAIADTLRREYDSDLYAEPVVLEWAAARTPAPEIAYRAAREWRAGRYPVRIP